MNWRFRLQQVAAALALMVMVATSAGAVESAAWNPTDEALSVEIHGILSRNQNIDPQQIEVVTKNGEVTLSGAVSNEFARDQAARVVGEVKGVHRVVNRLSIEGQPREDAELQQDVEWLLRNDPATSGLDITVSVEQGMVTLSGTVGSRQTAELARIISSGVNGVRGVDTTLEIRAGADGPRLSSDEIHNQIQRRLVAHEDVDARAVQIDVTDGAVVLSGVVGTAAEKRLVESLAWVGNVRSVDADAVVVDPMLEHNITVTADRNNDALRDDVLLTLLYEPRVNAFDLDVRVEGGVAFLSGTVDNLMAKQAAERAARSTRGIYRVENTIVVRSPETVAPLTVAENFKRNLAIDPVLSSEDIDIVVEGSKAILTGEVDTAYERHRAALIASRQRGIDHIENRITLADRTWKTDQEILADIKSELMVSAFVDASDIEVEVEDGVAILSGDVESWSEQKAAIENAYEGGARRVVSKLLVAGGRPEYVPYEDVTYESFTRPYWEN